MMNKWMLISRSFARNSMSRANRPSYLITDYYSVMPANNNPDLNSMWAGYSSLISADSSIIKPAICSSKPANRHHLHRLNNTSHDGWNLGTQQARYYSSLNAQESKQQTMTKSDYWGISSSHPLYKEDGSPWPWRSFKPSDTYTPDTTIDVSKHFEANMWVDKIALWTVERLRWIVDIFFKDRHVSHALLLETVAGVPGMVAGMLLHLKSLRRFEHSGGWIKALLEEAENERMHLMTWIEVSKPKLWERALVIAVQGVFFNGYTLLYILSPQMAHRFTGYLEEEAVTSYTNFLHAIDTKQMPNDPAPLIAIDYWRLPHDATIRDVVIVIRADEAHHRDVNHFAANLYAKQHSLHQSAAPLDYH